ncbi:phospholipase A(2)-like [Haliotis rufescens]|uniref:phospholipase A(2)-like n=1 Tax=Haliotis rufescens TaxID=6454 RepID=UPI00201F2116|nr:phospholipase A(2)-like [Haliotis rufescens]
MWLSLFLIALCAPLPRASPRGRWQVYVDGQRVLQGPMINGTFQACFLHSDNSSYQQLDGVIRLTPRQLDRNEAICHPGQDLIAYFHHLTRKRTRRSFHVVIWPGTRWCGAGAIARNYTDLGRYRETDRCCRDHDNCPSSIPGARWSSKHGLRNYGLVTRSECSCDRRFNDCLGKSSDKAADGIGIVYFNLLSMKCFDERPTPCTKRRRYGNHYPERCPKTWYFHDNIRYKPHQHEPSTGIWITIYMSNLYEYLYD